jgi:hypothetical protein
MQFANKEETAPVREGRAPASNDGIRSRGKKSPVNTDSGVLNIYQR